MSLSVCSSHSSPRSCATRLSFSKSMAPYGDWVEYLVVVVEVVEGLLDLHLDILIFQHLLSHHLHELLKLDAP